MLDEPTSNLDSLNEGMILKALKEECAEKTVVLVSHRQSTMKIADKVYEMETEESLKREKAVALRDNQKIYTFLANLSSTL